MIIRWHKWQTRPYSSNLPGKGEYSASLYLPQGLEVCYIDPFWPFKDEQRLCRFFPWGGPNVYDLLV